MILSNCFVLCWFDQTSRDKNSWYKTNKSKNISASNNEHDG